MSSYRGKHRKTSAVVKNIAKVGVAAAIVGIPAVAIAPSAGAVDWDKVAQCESGGNWSTNTGNGFHGGLQFTQSTWRANGGSGSPEGASRSEQIRVANSVLKTQGIGAWPVCGKKGGGGSTSDVSSSSHSYSSSSHKSSSKKTYSTKKVTSVQTGNGDYTVVSGDTLGKIADKTGAKGGWQHLFELNKTVLQDANTIFPGQKLDTK
jgi:LysM repeat protein